MFRLFTLVGWACGLLALLVLAAGARPQDVDGGPTRVVALPPAASMVEQAAPLPPTAPPTLAALAWVATPEVPPLAPEPPPPTATMALTPPAPLSLLSPVPSPTPSSTATAAEASVSPVPVGETRPLPTPAPRRWTFADGWTGSGFDEVIIATNAADRAARLRVTYQRPDLPPLVRQFFVPARGRLSIAIASDNDGVGRNNGRGWAVTTLVEGPDVPDLAVERSVVMRYRARVGTP